MAQKTYYGRIEHSNVVRQTGEDGFIMWSIPFQMNDSNYGSDATTGSPFIITNQKRKESSAPRLREVIEIMNQQKIITWLWSSDLGHFGDIEIKQGPFVPADLTLDAYTAIMKTLGVVGKESPPPTPLNYIAGYSRAQIKNEHISGTVDNLKYCLWGKVEQVLDGDTIYVRVEGLGEKLQAWMAVGDQARIRLAGIQAPETSDHSQEYGDEKNGEYARQFGVTQEVAYKIGAEAREFVKAVMKYFDGYVVVSIDSSSDGTPSADTYGRWIGMVYKTPYKIQGTWPTDNFLSVQHVNVNKTLIASPSSKKDSAGMDIPLAIVPNEYEYYQNDTRFSDIVTWKETIGLNSDYYARKTEEELAEYEAAEEARLLEERAKLIANKHTVRNVVTIYVPANTTVDGLMKEVKSREIVTSLESIAALNQVDMEGLERMLKAGGPIKVPNIEIVTENVDLNNFGTAPTNSEELANNMLDFFEPIDDRGDLSSDFHLRIGDVEFVVPPLSIQVNRNSHLEKVKTLRTKSSMITKVGSSTTTITLQLYFHDLESINGKKISAGFHYEHEKGVPESITYAKRKVQDYYHVNGLRSLIAQFKKAPFLGIENEFLNDVHDIQSVALVNLSVATVPGFPHSLSATLTLAKFEHEAYMPHVEFLDRVINFPMFRWYYQDCMNPKHKDNPYKTYLAPIEGQLTNDFYFTLASEDALQERNEAIKELRFMETPAEFAEKAEEGQNNMGRIRRDANRVNAALAQRKKYMDLKAKGKIPTDGSSFLAWDEIGRQIYDTTTTYEAMFMPKELHGQWGVGDDGEFQLALETNSNIELVKSATGTDGSAGVYRIKGFAGGADATPPSEHPLAKILEVAKGIDAKINAYKVEYKKIQQQAEATEGQLPMTPYYIDDMIITSMNVTYENSFSSIQLAGLDNPTLQYLGAQDPYLHVTMETTSRDAIEQLKDLLETADRYAREYRYGITSGFIGIENQLTRLFGVTTVMPESIQVNTVPGYVDRFQIEMVLCGFNKTQKRTESLEGFAAVDPSKAELTDRHVSKDPLKSDAVIIERKMHNLEVYPDLELPTHDELIEALPRLNAGILMYHNPTGAKYVDPDFYVTTNWTMRQYLWAERIKKTEADSANLADYEKRSGFGSIAMRDLAGYSGYAGVNSENMFDFDSEDMITAMAAVDERMRAVVVESNEITDIRVDVGTGVSSDQIYGPPAPPGTSNVTAATDSSMPANSMGLEDFRSSKTAYQNKPDPVTWGSWFGYTPSQIGSFISQYNYYFEDLKKKVDTAEMDAMVYQEIYKWIDEYFGKRGLLIPDDGHTLYNDQYSNYKILTYASVADIYRAAFRYATEKNSKYAGYKVEDPTGFKYAIYRDAVDKAGGKAGKPLITRERLANYIKSIFHKESGWSNYLLKNGVLVPKRNYGGSWAMGIGQIFLFPWHAHSVSQAQRFCWDWRYNVQYAVSYFLEKYLEAANHSDIKLSCQPWDWAIRSYEQGNWKTHSISQYVGKLVTPYYADVIAIFGGDGQGNKIGYYNHESNMFNTPHKQDNMNVRTLAQSISGAPEAMLLDDKEAWVENTWKLVEQINNMEWNRKKKWIDEYPRTKLEDMTLDELKALNKEISDKLIEERNRYGGYYSMGGSFVATYGNEAQQQAYSEILVPDSLANSRKVFDEIAASKKATKDQSKLRLVNTDNPGAAFRDSFTDMCEYDQRGRLIRAFPTFQMFIIDEGRWMSSYRLWDNLYGFNAIQSIDVHKNRKIAADTCVIKMTNVYSNLTARTLDSNYGDWQYNWWDNLFWGKPNDSIIEARKELVNGMMLQTGARLHLRMGYSADASQLPIMFNGTITEMDAQDVVTLIAQGDGIELTNPISADPNETNDRWWRKVREPRDFLCYLLTSRGNWFKNVLNSMTDGAIYKENPLGVLHFGVPAKIPEALVPLNWYNDNYGEAAQNIYSSNGQNTFSQWIYTSDSEEHAAGESIGWGWSDNGWTPVWPEGDEMDIEIQLYNQTIWKVAQTFAYCSPDYIAAVHPFELRSTLFFGKPYYKLAYRYDSQWTWNAEEDVWERKITSEYRKPYSQYHIYDSTQDIVNNKIKASEEGIYTNVIVKYGSETTDPQMADSDIRIDKQKTVIIEAPIVSRSGLLNTLSFGTWNFFTAEKQAIYYACSALRDYMKEMYKGQLLILGDPTVKPYDAMYFNDTMNSMNGTVGVRAVTHHFSFETGFVTSIEPDAMVVNDDTAMINQATWLTSVGMALTGYVLGRASAARAFRRIVKSVRVFRANGLNKKTDQYIVKALHNIGKLLPGDDPAMRRFTTALKLYNSPTAGATAKEIALRNMQKAFTEIETKLQKTVDDKTLKKAGKFAARRLLYTTKGILETAKIAPKLKSIADAGKAIRFIRTAGGLLSSATGIGILANIALSVGVSTLQEMYRRKKARRQAVIMVPLMYQGRQFTAGINGHQGMVVGDKPGKWDQFFMGLGYGGDKEGIDATFGQIANLFADGSIAGNKNYATGLDEDDG